MPLVRARLRVRLPLRASPATERSALMPELSWRDAERGRSTAPELGEAASRTHLVSPGPVPDASAAVVDGVASERLVAFSGGRVIDSAKAVAAVRGGEVAAIPTTLSGAPMTAIHRLPEEHSASSRVRPSLVIGYAETMTSAPEPQLRATAMNALAHGAES